MSLDVYGTSDPLEYYHYANALAQAGDYARAIAHYEKAIALDPDGLDAEVYVSAAWLLATCPDPQLRNGELAVRFAEEGCAVTDWSESWPLGVLAAACAQHGGFERAIELQRKACLVAGPEERARHARQLELLEAGHLIPHRPTF